MNKLTSIENLERKDRKWNEESSKKDEEDDDVDPINAYFKQRCSRSSTSSIFNQRESEDGSSLGILDIDNISLLDDMHRYSSGSQKLQDDLNCLNTKNLSKKSQELATGKSENVHDLFLSIIEPPESELRIKKNREQAKQNLLKLNERLENRIKSLKSLYHHTGEPLQVTSEPEKKNLSSNLSVKMNMQKWFEKNQSPHTPRYFVDELNSMCDSLGAACSSGLADSNGESKPTQESVFNSETFRNKEFSSLLEDAKVSDASEFTFEAQTPGEIMNRLEEDEKKFLKDQSALSNNSDISHFSGITEDNVRQRNSSSSMTSQENDRVSIGKYFELRSHSINSLVGAKESAESANCLEKSDPSTVKRESFDKTLENEPKVTEVPYSWKNHSKRWHSSCELKGNEIPAVKQSTESSGSTSTLLIQDLLRGMDSELSGTQINDRLLECLGKTVTKKKHEPDHMETPKSSKTSGRIGTFRKGIMDKLDPLAVSDPIKDQFRSPLAGKKSISKSCSRFSEADFDDSTPKSIHSRPKYHKNMQSLKNEHFNTGKPFDSSTPKFENVRSGAGKFKSACSKLLLNDVDWAMPRLSSIQKPRSVNDSMSGEESDKTVVLNSTIMPSNEKKDEIGGDLHSVEDTIAAGDLTVVSERIKEMKKDGTVILSPCEDEDVLLVVQELANFPKGSVDCSALTPLLRDQFPELLSAFSLRSDQTKCAEDSYDLGQQTQELVPLSTDSWVKFSSKWERKDLCIAVDVTKVISAQIKNQTKDWLIASLESMCIQCPSDVPQREKYLTAAKVKDAFHVGDFLSVSVKDTLISPGAMLSCKIHLSPKVPVTLPVRLKFEFKKLITKESRTQDLCLKIKCIFPRNNITIKPPNEINFGVIPEECSQQEIVTVTFDGACDLPLKVYIDKSENFKLSPYVTLNGERIKRSIWKEKVFYYMLNEGGKAVLQFKLIFRPRVPVDNNKNKQVDLKATLSIAVDTPAENCILRQVQMNGSVAFTKFLCVSSTPLIFRVTGKGNSVKKSFPLKNIGAVELKFKITVAGENSEEQTDGLFTVPSDFTLPKDEERCFDIVFNGETNENYIRRNLLLQMEPNGMCYEVELTGAVMPVIGGKSLSRTSSQSGMTKYLCSNLERLQHGEPVFPGPSHSVYNPENVPFHIKSTSQAISWPAVRLDVEMKQTFFILNSSNCNAMARFSFRKETSAFKFLNDNGKSIEKLRKLLKPNCSNAMTVIFRPNCIGPHVNSIIIETNDVSGRKMISLNGYGGSPKIFIRNLKSDLNGSKIIRLVNSEPENQSFHATLEFINKGNISGFVSIKTIFMVLSVGSLLEIEPSDFVVQANSKIEVRISQKLRNDDLKRLLSGKDICKLATVAVTTGDESSRLRLKKLVKEDKINASDSIGFLLKEFINEKNEEFNKFVDDERFETAFRKNLETVEIAVIVERANDEGESTILEVAEETVKEFVTILPAADYSIASLRDSGHSNSSSMKKFSLDKSNLSASSGGSLNSSNKNVSNWLEASEKS